VDLFDFDQRLGQALHDMPFTARALLLRVLSLPDEERAKAIGVMHQDWASTRLGGIADRLGGRL
jgi:hypothetical protein